MDQLCQANASEGGRPIVVLAEKDKEEMEEELAKHGIKEYGSRIIFRCVASVLSSFGLGEAWHVQAQHPGIWIQNHLPAHFRCHLFSWIQASGKTQDLHHFPSNLNMTSIACFNPCLPDVAFSGIQGYRSESCSDVNGTWLSASV